MSSEQPRFQIAAICCEQCCKTSAQEANFITTTLFSASEVSDPSFRVACKWCLEDHVLLSKEQVLEDPLAFASVPRGYAFLTGVFGGKGVREEQIAALLPRREIARLSIEESLQRLPKPRVERRRDTPRVGRNDPCPCNSGKKFKKCHGVAKEIQ